MTDALYVAPCPLKDGWESGPLGTSEAAFEAVRAHLAGHSHADLVRFLAEQHFTTTRFDREATKT